MSNLAQNISLSSSWRRWFPGILVAGSVLSLRFGWLALPVGFGCFIAAVTLPVLREHGAKRPGWWVAAAGFFVSVALARFLVVEGMDGIVHGGRQAVERKAVSKLREILFAQDAVRRLAWIDPDADGAGSAALLSELCTGQSARASAPLKAPVLRCESLHSSSGARVSQEGAYRFKVCLPQGNADWSADENEPVDAELSESRFAAYAWPAPNSGFAASFYLDQEENIFIRRGEALANRDAGVTEVGVSEGAREGGPPCDSAVSAAQAAAAGWEVWRGKKPRSAVP